MLSIYKSSAGSGKTYTLVSTFLEIVLKEENPSYFRHVLAITFTNKAASEMKERILKALLNISLNDISEEFRIKKLEAELGIPSSLIIKRAGNIYTNVLHKYSLFNIITIDSFIQKIVQTFSHDLKMPENSRVEMDTDPLITQAVDNLMMKYGTVSNKNLTDAIDDLIFDSMEGTGKWNLDYKLYSFAKTLFKEENLKKIVYFRNFELENYFLIKKSLNEIVNNYRNKVIEYKEELIKIFADYNLQEEDFPQKSRGLLPKVLILEKIIYLDKEASFISPLYTNSGKFNNLQNALPAIIKVLDSFFENQNQNFANYEIAKNAYSNLYKVILLIYLEKEVEEIMQKEQIVPFAMFNFRVNQEVRKQHAVFLYERLGNRFQHILIDEFQDTSEMQWQNVLPLVAESVSKGFLSMIVGDCKQSIYRWRGGKVEQFTYLPEPDSHITDTNILSHYLAFNENFKLTPLTTNYRSKENVIDFNNNFFKRLLVNSSEFISMNYEDVKQEFNYKHKKGYVEAKSILKDDVIIETLNTINSVIEDGYNYKDICVLIRNNNEGVEIAQHLIKNNFPVISPDSLALNSNNNVNLIIAVLELACNVNKSANVSFIWNFIKNKNSFGDISKEFILNPLAYLFQEGEHKLYEYPLYECVILIATRFNLNIQHDTFIVAFLDQIHAFAKSNGSSIIEFIENWKINSNKYRVDNFSSQNAISIMTIHKSKGLEFPVVIFVNYKKGMEQVNDDLWIPTPEFNEIGFPELLVSVTKESKVLSDKYAEYAEYNKFDNINLLYVAFTRAIERLYIKVDKNGKNTIAQLIEANIDFDENGFFEFGEKEIKENNLIELNDFNKQKVECKFNTDLIKFNSVASLSKGFDESGSKGRLFHKIISEIKTAEDIIPAINNLQNEYEISEHELNSWVDLLAGVVNNPSISHLFSKSNKVKNEISILLKNGELYRPDRVVFFEDNSIHILDYKTGLKSKNHKKQLGNYIDIMHEMGFPNASGWLFYTQTMEAELCN